jgi:hypothetical protein
LLRCAYVLLLLSDSCHYAVLNVSNKFNYSFESAGAYCIPIAAAAASSDFDDLTGCPIESTIVQKFRMMKGLGLEM